MKNLSKILCAVLVLALLCSSLALVVSAEFTPSAKVTKYPIYEKGDGAATADQWKELIDVVNSSDEGNLTHYYVNPDTKTSAMIAEIQSDEFAGSVVEYGEGKSYFQIDTLKDGKNAGHIQWYFHATGAGDAGIKYDANNATYVVLEFDLATESDLTSFAIIANNRSEAAGKGNDPGGAPNYGFDDMFNIEPGTFHHITVIQDLNNNTMHFFDNGKQVKTGAAFGTGKTVTNPDKTVWQMWKEGVDYVDNDKSYNFKTNGIFPGFKIQAYSGYGFTDLSKGQSSMYDNVYTSILKGDAAGNLADALAAGSLTDWDKNRFNADYELPTIPALAKIGETTYYTRVSVEAAIEATPNLTVEMLRDVNFPITVNNSCTFITNGFDTSYTAGPDAFEKSYADGVAIIEKGYPKTVSYSDADYKNITSAVAGNIVTGASQANVGDALPLKHYTGTTFGNADSYLASVVYKDHVFNKKEMGNVNNPYLSVATTATDISIKEGTSAYYVTEFDIAAYGAVINNASVQVELRNKSTGGGFPFGPLILFSDVAKSGEWAHVTAVSDIAANKTYLFVNGEFVKEAGYAYQASSLASANEETLVLKSIRFQYGTNDKDRTYAAGENIFLDNVAMRVFADSAAANGLADAITAKSLTGWALNNTAHRGGEKLGAIAIVNGTPMYSNEEITNFVANAQSAPDVEFVQQPLVPVVLDNAAKIFTNGICDNELLYTKGENVTSEYPADEDNAWTLGVGFISSQKSESISEGSVVSHIKYDADDNMLKAIARSGSVRLFNAITDRATGNTFVRAYTNNDATGDSNSFVNISLNGDKEFKYKEGENNYFIFDFDFAADHYELVHPAGNSWKLGIQLIHRPSMGTSFGSRVLYEDLELELGTFTHLTWVYDYTDNALYIFADGKLIKSYEEGGYVLSTDHHAAYLAGTAMSFSSYDSISFRSNSNSSINYDNFYLRRATFAADADELSKACESGNLSDWSANVYNDSYVMPTFGTLATVNGVAYDSAPELSKALTGNTAEPVTVEFMRSSLVPVHVRMDSHFVFNGQSVKLTYGSGITKTNDDGTIDFDSDFIPEDPTYAQGEKIEVGTSKSYAVTSEWAKHIYSSIADNKFSNIIYKSYNVETARSAFLVQLAGSDNIYVREERTNGAEVTADTYYEWGCGVVDYKNGANQVIAVDFDVAVDDLDTPIEYLVNTRKYTETGNTYVSGQSMINITAALKNAGVYTKEFVHITMILDPDTGISYVFVNNKLALTAEKTVYNPETITETDKLFLAGIRSQKSQAEYSYDNVAIRIFEDANIKSLIEGGDISTWTNAAYSDKYVLPVAPAIAIVDDKNVESLEELEDLLSDGGNHQVEIRDYIPEDAKIVLNSSITVKTNGLVDATKLFDTSIEGYHEVKDLTGATVLVTDKFVHTAPTVGSTHKFDLITAETYAGLSTVVTWTLDANYENCVVIAYTKGTPITAPVIAGQNVLNGKLEHAGKWIVFDGTTTEGEIVTDFGVAEASTTIDYLSTGYVYSDLEADFAVDLAAQLTLGNNLTFKVLIPAANVTMDAEKTTIEGVEFYVVEFKLNAIETAKTLEVSFTVTNGDQTFTQTNTLSVLDYVTALLASDAVADADKNLAVAAMAYSAEAYKLLATENAELTALLEANAARLPAEAEGTVADTTALAQVIRSVALRLDNVPTFQFKLAYGLKGTIKLGDAEAVAFDTTAGETVVLHAVDVLAANDDIAVVITLEGADAPIEGTYNLATYASKLESNAFAKALMNYAAVAKANATPADPAPEAGDVLTRENVFEGLTGTSYATYAGEHTVGDYTITTADVLGQDNYNGLVALQFKKSSGTMTVASVNTNKITLKVVNNNDFNGTAIEIKIGETTLTLPADADVNAAKVDTGKVTNKDAVVYEYTVVIELPEALQGDLVIKNVGSYALYVASITIG